jgi:hypothetical protein
VVVDGLDPGQFAPLCRRLGGDDVDGVSGLPQPGGVTIAEIDRQVAAADRRDTAAERAALRAHWHID